MSSRRIPARLILLATFMAAIVASECSARAQTADPIVDVRVFWIVKVNAPNTTTSSPQFITVLSEDGTVNHHHSVLEFNHNTAPDFSKGGVQQQHWNGDKLVSAAPAWNPGVSLRATGETIRFIHRMTLASTTASDGTISRYLSFRVEQLESSTWGNTATLFGKSVPTGRTSLDSFDVTTSQKESLIAAGENRIESMMIDRIELTHASGAVTSDSNDYYVKAPSQ